jgi:nondiscriminating aspartyl-tRNA synthetase
VKVRWHRETVPLARASWATSTRDEEVAVERVLSTELARHAGRPVRLAGWVHRRRQLSRVGFLILRDRAGLAQVVVTEPSTLDGLPEETAVVVTGTAVANPDAPGGFEVVAPSIEAVSPPAQTPPVHLHRPDLAAALPVLLDTAPVTLRHPRRRAVFRIAASATAGFRSTMDRLGGTEVHTPKLVASATEGGANVFPVDYFGRPAYLAQSPQFYKQMLVGVFERVYEVGPVFRAEPHDTARHLAQYTSLDVEVGFVRDHTDVMAVLREVLAGMLRAVGERAAAELDLLGVTPPANPVDVPTLHFADAMAMLGTAEPDLSPDHERRLGAWASREYGSDWLFVTGYPMVKRPFYTHPEPGRPSHSNSFDLLFRGVELVTGGQRLHRYADVVAALVARGERVEPSYVDTFRYGMPPHGGFAIGLERFVARLVGAANVRETALFPRDLHRLTP